MPLLFSFAMLAFSVVTLIDIITRDNGQVKHLPKVAWVIVAILLPLLGGILWWAIGREYPERPARPVVLGRPATSARPVAPAPRPVDTRTTEQQLADLEREIEEERLRAELVRRRRERGEV